MRLSLFYFVIIILFALNSIAQDINFSSQYDKLLWPGNSNLQGGITGDDWNWSRLVLFHGHSIAFQTNSNTPDFSKTRMYLTGTGNLGIGTTSPAFKLDVIGKIRASDGFESQGSVAGNHAFFSNYQDGNFGNWFGNGFAVPAYNLLGNDNPNAGFGIAEGSGVISPIIWMGDGPMDALRIRKMTSNTTMATGIDVMVVRSGGNVGVGIGKPTEKFSVKGHSSLIAKDHNGSWLRLKSPGGIINPQTLEDNDNGYFEIGYVPAYGNTYVNFKGGIFFRNFDDPNILRQNVMGILHDAVTIGVWESYDDSYVNLVPNGYKLMVNGGILCEKLKVIEDVPDADYVFEDEYELLSIEEVKEFIQKHKHLPEVPSAKEFKENGYTVGEMDELLLKKVEELTLYIIELQEELNKLKKNN